MSEQKPAVLEWFRDGRWRRDRHFMPMDDWEAALDLLGRIQKYVDTPCRVVAVK